MRRLILCALLLVCGYATCPAQGIYVDSDTVEGQLLQEIDAQPDMAKKLQLLERFAREFPNHEAVVWVLSHLQSAALENKDYDRVLELATRILSVDPDDLASAHNALRAVEAKGETEFIQRWAKQTSVIARRVMKSKPPDDPESEADWKAKVEFAKQVEVYTEYSLYFAALQAQDARKKSELIEALEQRNPKSEYLAHMRTSQAVVVRQVDAEEAVRSAEASFEKGEYNIDQLFMVSAHYMRRGTDPEKVVAYGTKLLEMMPDAAKPDGMSDPDWEARRTDILGQTNWMVGLIHSTQERFGLADKFLRASLEHIRTNNDMVAGALYHLGYANYRLAEAGDRVRIHEAVKFTFECSKIQSAVQAQAAENLKSMKAEYALPDELMPKD
jgi:tetratricopeptide (TPR) repeat protein